MITYKEVEDYFNEISTEVTTFIREYDAALVKGRDSQGVPLYATKCRPKTVNSIYLKTKRKDYGLDRITDYAGIRALCLVEQDLQGVLRFIVNYVKTRKRSNHDLVELSVYNFDEAYTALFKNIVSDVFPNCDIRTENKGSGYKSIHLLVLVNAGNRLKHEIQVRTLLQDVWGELGHAIAYKQGNIHPHIHKSFGLLAKDLQTNDDLIAHLRNIGDREKLASRFSLQETGTTFILDYEDGLLPEALTSGRAKQEIGEYNKYVAEHHNYRDVDWVREAREKYNAVVSLVHTRDCDYWIQMEDAFLLFSERKHDEAIKLYKKVIYDGHDNKYVPRFRLGELYFIKGDIEKSLIEFDKSEVAIDCAGVTNINKYHLMKRLAYVYWFYGEEYIDLALTKILIADSVYNGLSNADFIKHENINNVCYYTLEKFIRDRNKLENNAKSFALKDYEEDSDIVRTYVITRERFRLLEEAVKALDEQERKSNYYDTMAWFCYHASLAGDETREYLSLAYEYCRHAWNKETKSIHSINTGNLLRIHTQDIMAEIDKNKTPPLP